jgi:hypothetical protein
MPASVGSVPSAAPRRVRPSAYLLTADGALLLLGALWLAAGAGLALGLAFAPGAWDDVLLTVRGRGVQGRALAVVPTDSALRSRPVMEIRFAYKDGAGTVRQARSRSSDDELLRRARLGGDLPVHYDRFLPARARVDGTRLSPFGVFPLFTLLLGGAGAAVTLIGLVRVSASRALLTHGHLSAGRVVDSSVSDGLLRKRRPFDVRYVFEGPGGELSGVAAAEDAPRAGAEVAVVYDPERPWRSTLPPQGAFAPDRSR